MLPTITGCPPPGPVVSQQPAPPRPSGEIVDGIRANSAKLDRPLWSSSVSVTARFKDDQGRSHLLNLEGSLLFRKPRDLRIDLRHGLSDKVMGIGSNDGDYWVWIEPELNMMRWGRHRYSGKPCAEKILVRPDQLAALLGFGGLPEPGDDLIGPVRKYGKQFDILSYSRRYAGELVLDREYFIDRVPPFLVRLVVLYDQFGRRVMSAMLDDYRPAWPDGPQTPLRINIRWPQEEGGFTLSALAFEGRTTVSPRAFVRPAQQELPRGVRDYRQVDADCDAAPSIPSTLPAN